MLRVRERFYSVQGEGVHQGIPTVFIRLAGCPLIPHCTWCDSGYSQEAADGKDISIEDLVKEAKNLRVSPNSWACLTGGEPLWQEPELGLLVEALKKEFFQVEVFTNGMYNPPKWWTKVDSWVVDMKVPSSGVCGVSKDTWYGLRYTDQIKFTVGNNEDLEWSKKQIRKHRATFNGTYVVSPVITNAMVGSITEQDALFAQKVVDFCKQENVRFSLQVHKVLWGNKKGV